MKLSELLADYVSVDHDVDITGLALDSRTVQAGDLFIALAGAKQHGLSHAEQAIANGAIAVLYEDNTMPSDGFCHRANHPTILFIAIDNLSAKLGDIAARFYDYPSQALSVIGITGTNGKTSCSQFLAQVVNDCGIIGTLGWGEWGNLHKTLNTTPDALAVQQILAALRDSNKRSVAMEVSSHGLQQGRVGGVKFTGAVFTNISRDHLDYHGTMDAYLQAKLALLNSPELEFAVVNLNDDYSQQIIAAVPLSVALWTISTDETNANCIPSSLGSGFGWANYTSEHITAGQITYAMDGIHFTVHWRDVTQQITVPLYGDFNTENVLCVLAVMLALTIPLNVAAARLARLHPVIGRMERFGGEEQPLVFVDYAHTPDALEKALRSARQHCEAKLSLVFGCGGNRDTGKRAEMGGIAAQFADSVIITNDNPRFEQPLDIISDILANCHGDHVIVIPDRATAIQTALALATEQDCVVIAGKGHEDYQEINGVRTPFSDRDVVMQTLRDMK